MFELRERIQSLVGPHQPLADDFSFLQPGGNEHLIQFAFLNCTDEYRELDNWDRFNLLLTDLYAATDIEFDLDEDGRFATFVSKNPKGVKNIQTVIDLRDDSLIVIYFFGDSKACHKLNQRLFQFPAFSPCFLNTTTLIEIAGLLDSIGFLQYNFEQLPSMFLEPVVMKGKLVGEMAHKLCYEFVQQHEPYFYIEKISGQVKEGSQGTTSFDDTGLIKVDSGRLSEFLKVAEIVFKILKNRYQNLLKKSLIQWQVNPSNSMLICTGSPIDVCLVSPINNINGLIKLFTQGQQKMHLIGTAERVSRKMWCIKSSEWNTSEQIEFEISEKLIRIYLLRKSTIPLLDRIERYIRKHINAELDTSSL